jgi:hypothetical protein
MMTTVMPVIPIPTTTLTGATVTPAILTLR